MAIILWLLLILILLILAVGLWQAFLFIRRRELVEVHFPDEYGLQFEPIEFNTKDGLTLRGVWIPASGSDKAVIILHGHGSGYYLDIYHSPALHEAGFNVLLFDFRAHGRSDGKWMTLGYKERWDVLGAIDFVRKRGIQHIGLLGSSYGGMAAMLTAPISPDVEAVITDGGPANLMTGSAAWAVEHGLPVWLTKAVAWWFFCFLSLLIGANLFKYAPIRWVGKISPRPILFIHGDHDLYCADFDELYAAANQPKEMWRLPEAGHATASQLYPEEYARRVNDFFNRYL